MFSFLFVFIGQDSVLIYRDRFDYRTGSFLGIMSKRRTYYFADIKSFTLNGGLTFMSDVVEDVISETGLRVHSRNYLDIVLKDGTEHTFRTKVYKSDLQKVIEQYQIFNSK